MFSKWYESFFDTVTLDFWDEANSDAETLAEIDMIEQLLELSPRSCVLDIPCGPGRHLFGLASRGYQVTGVDLSPEALRRAERRTADCRSKVELVCQDMRSIAWSDCFDGAFCLGNSFGYFDRPGTDQFLGAVARALKEGGRFVLDSSMVAESLLPQLDERHWLHAGDLLLLVENDYRVSESRLDTLYTFVRDGRSHCRTAHHYVFTLSEVRRMLEGHRLNVEGLFASTELDPFELGSQRLLLLARKTENAPE